MEHTVRLTRYYIHDESCIVLCLSSPLLIPGLTCLRCGFFVRVRFNVGYLRFFQFCSSSAPWGSFSFHSHKRSHKIPHMLHWNVSICMRVCVCVCVCVVVCVLEDCVSQLSKSVTYLFNPAHPQCRDVCVDSKASRLLTVRGNRWCGDGGCWLMLICCQHLAPASGNSTGDCV